MQPLQYIKSLKIRRKDGTEIDINSSFVELQSGVRMDVSADKSRNAVTLSAGADKGVVDAEMQAKFKALIDGGSGSVDGVPYSFSGAPYYYSSINSVDSYQGHSFLLARQCVHFGLFESLPYPESADGRLHITDVCPPCVNCGEYQTMYLFLEAIRNALEEKRALIYEHVDYVPGDTEQRNIMELYKQTMLYWNNMVQRTAWRCSALADGNEINAACMFTNHFDTDIPSGLVMRAFFSGMSDGSTTPRGVIIDHSVPSGWVENVDYSLFTEPSGYAYPHPSTWTADYSAKELTVVPDANQDHPLPSVAAGDFIRVLTVSDPVCSTRSYKVKSGDENSFVLDVTDMPSSGSAGGSMEWRSVVKLGIETHTPLENGEHIKLYLGTVIKDYTGSGDTVEVIFENNIKNFLPGYPDTKSVVTNNMVVLS